MKRAERDRILARKKARQDALLASVKKRKPQLVAKSVASKINGAASMVSPTPTEEEPAPTLVNVVSQYVEEYAAAQLEIARQRDRLIELRGGEDNLTEEDREALENIRDIVSARYERLLEV